MTAAPEARPADTYQMLEVDVDFTSESHFFAGLSNDVREGGLFYSTYRPLPVRIRVDVVLTLPGSAEPLRGMGKVAWVREHSLDGPRGVGIAFEYLSNDTRERILAFCNLRPPIYYDVL
jgi:uncharacterized protein (TIGR02266 family)